MQSVGHLYAEHMQWSARAIQQRVSGVVGTTAVLQGLECFRGGAHRRVCSHHTQGLGITCKKRIEKTSYKKIN